MEVSLRANRALSESALLVKPKYVPAQRVMILLNVITQAAVLYAIESGCIGEWLQVSHFAWA
jgi:hypothetical protein